LEKLKMKRLVLLLALVAGFAAPAYAAGERIAVVDMVELISQHPRATELQRKLDQRRTEAEKHAMDEQKAMRDLQAQIELMNRNNPMRRVREKELLTTQTMLKLEIQWREEEALREYMTGLESIYAEIQRQVARYAKDNQIPIVLLKTDVELRAVDFNDFGAKVRLRSVVYHDAALDITDKIRATFMPRATSPDAGPDAADVEWRRDATSTNRRQGG
jgi:Skp family chaperone for outer membrane proteins